MTQSELLLERFCAQRRMLALRVPTASHVGERRPDYRVRSRWRRRRWLWIEVKEIRPNAEEVAQIAALESGRQALFSTEPGKKMRSLIDSGAPQLKAVKGPRDPALLLVHDTTAVLRQHTDPYAILTAMRGLDVVPVHLPPHPNESPVFGQVRAGGNRRMTEDQNTSVSGVGIIYEKGRRAIALDLFHNPFASTPLRAADVDGPLVRHFAMTLDQSDWRKVYG